MQIDFLVLICGYFNKFVVYIFVTVPLGNSEDFQFVFCLYSWHWCDEKGLRDECWKSNQMH